MRLRTWIRSWVNALDGIGSAVPDFMRIRILSARREILSGEAEEVILPGEDGELSILNFHQPCIARLKPGSIRVLYPSIKGEARRQEGFMIRRGVARVGLPGLSILIEEAVKRGP